MRNKVLLFSLLFFQIFAHSQHVVPEYIQKRVNAIAQQIKPAIVKIYAVIPDYYQGKEIKREVSGSGTIIHPDGFILTNYHVAGRASYIRCILADGEKVDAYYYAGDPLTDLAIVKLKIEKKFPFAKFGDSSKLKVGDWVIAAGSPYALSQSLTLGIVSNTRLVLPEIFFQSKKIEIEGEDVGSMITWIGHDAPIYGGNSGGPLLNLEGEIVGVNEIKIGLGGAIPGNIAKKVAGQLMKNKEITRSWLGINIQPLLTTSKMKEGVLVSGVLKGSPAERVGIQPGDIILEIGDRKVKVETIEDVPGFNQLISELPLDRDTRVLLLQKDKKRVVFIRPVKREKTYYEIKEIKQLSITARDISPYEMLKLKRDSQEGVLVTSVRPGGPIGEAKPPLTEGDVITEIDRKKVKNIEELMRYLKEIRGETPFIIRFERGKEKMVTVVRLREEKEVEIIPYAKKAWLPIDVQSATDDIREKLNLKKRGVIVTLVFTKESSFPIKVGDIIVEIEGESLPIRSMADKMVFFERLSNYSVGEEIELTIIREGKEIKERINLSTEPPSKAEVAKYKEPSLGMTVRELCFDDIKALGEEKEGVMIEEIEEGNWASLAGLAVGDLILEINEEKVQDISSFKEHIEKLKTEKKDIVFLVERGIEKQFVEIKNLLQELKQ